MQPEKPATDADQRASLEERLDEALEESFPASDPIAIDTGPAPAAPTSLDDRKA